MFAHTGNIPDFSTKIKDEMSLIEVDGLGLPCCLVLYLYHSAHYWLVLDDFTSPDLCPVPTFSPSAGSSVPYLQGVEVGCLTQLTFMQENRDHLPSQTCN